MKKDHHVTITNVDVLEYHCDQCDYKVKTQNTLIRHKQIKHGISSYQCFECGDNLRQKTTMCKHMKTNHYDTTTKSAPQHNNSNIPTLPKTFTPGPPKKDKNGKTSEFSTVAPNH